VDVAMQDTSCFQLIALLGKGHISCFVRGKGEWCGAQTAHHVRPGRSLPGHLKRQLRVKDDAYFSTRRLGIISPSPSPNASEISFYLDGAPLVTVHAKGRPFSADDIDALQAIQ